MPATTEMLTEQITQLKEQISSKKKNGLDTLELEQQVSELTRRLMSASAALNENRQILKG